MEAMWEHACPIPATHVQWAHTTAPPVSMATQGFRWSAETDCECLTLPIAICFLLTAMASKNNKVTNSNQQQKTDCLVDSYMLSFPRSCKDLERWRHSCKHQVTQLQEKQHSHQGCVLSQPRTNPVHHCRESPASLHIDFSGFTQSLENTWMRLRHGTIVFFSPSFDKQTYPPSEKVEPNTYISKTYE